MSIWDACTSVSTPATMAPRAAGLCAIASVALASTAPALLLNSCLLSSGVGSGGGAGGRVEIDYLDEGAVYIEVDVVDCHAVSGRQPIMPLEASIPTTSPFGTRSYQIRVPFYQPNEAVLSRVPKAPAFYPSLFLDLGF